MTEKQIQEFARGLADYEGTISDRDRLRFACLVRDVARFSRAWPGLHAFMRDAKIPQSALKND